MYHPSNNLCNTAMSFQGLQKAVNIYLLVEILRERICRSHRVFLKRFLRIEHASRIIIKLVGFCKLFEKLILNTPAVFICSYFLVMMNNIERYLRRFSNIAPPGTNVLKSDSFIVKRTGRIDYNKSVRPFSMKALVSA